MSEDGGLDVNARVIDEMRARGTTIVVWRSGRLAVQEGRVVEPAR